MPKWVNLLYRISDYTVLTLSYYVLLYCSKHFTYTNLFNSQSNNMRQILLSSPSNRWVMQLVSGRPGMETQVDWLQMLVRYLPKMMTLF